MTLSLDVSVMDEDGATAETATLSRHNLPSMTYRLQVQRPTVLTKKMA
ncbi:hypothetical protein O9993_21640 [Vibrio lentus]|nr:hypothetical protein [Vibrio lentus]